MTAIHEMGREPDGRFLTDVPGCVAVCPYARQHGCTKPLNHDGPHGDGDRFWSAPPMDPRVDVPSAMTSRHLSETAEHYTPVEIVEYARATLGRIDLDPASCSEANEVVKASLFLTEEHNGYLAEWRADGVGQKELRVFLNPPGGWCDVNGHRVIKARTVKGVTTPGCVVTGACGMAAPHHHVGTDSAQKRWWEKLAASWARGTVRDAFFVCFSIELLQSTQVDAKPPLPLEFPICYPSRRLAYRKPGGKIGASPPHASCLVLLSDDPMVISRFYEIGTGTNDATETPSIGHVAIPSMLAGAPRYPGRTR